jgi:hypothetical protein
MYTISYSADGLTFTISLDGVPNIVQTWQPNVPGYVPFASAADCQAAGEAMLASLQAAG